MDWNDWKWQLRNALKATTDFAKYFDVSPEEQSVIDKCGGKFMAQTTPYYAALARRQDRTCPIRKISIPDGQELTLSPQQEMLDPLGEQHNRPTSRIVHRYPDRVLFWLTDQCSVYCRYCTRKHFTASGQSKATSDELVEAVEYVSKHPEIREVIFSGGDPLVASDEVLLNAIEQFYKLPNVEIIRLGTRVPVVLPMRISPGLLLELKKFKPIFLMTHFNHPDELSDLSAERLELFVDHGIPVFNQMVLLNGINNHPALVQALSRRLLHLRIKPYYMFQCDPSLGTDHFRTSIEDSLQIQRALWGRVSGLMMPSLSLDIPGGGGKVSFAPGFLNGSQPIDQENLLKEKVSFKGFDGVCGDYHNPPPEKIIKPVVGAQYQEEWNRLRTLVKSSKK